MATITGKKAIFFVTSPRSPLKMVEEIKFLVENFSGREWTTKTQGEYYKALTLQPFFKGGRSVDHAFSARDIITRGPKSLGLVDLKPTIALTPAGREFVYENRPEEALLRQMLKFQFPSPYHVDTGGTFSVKPYLELMRFVQDLDGLTKTEIALFVMQLTNYANFETIKSKILSFRDSARENREQRSLNYREFVARYFERELRELFTEEISKGELSTRESNEATLHKYITTKQRNHTDYADAAIRYLRATKLFTYNARSLRVSVMPERIADITHILETIPREPTIFASEDEYGDFLFSATTPTLFTDSREKLIQSIISQNKAYTRVALQAKGIGELKDTLTDILNENLELIITEQRSQLRTYGEYEDIQDIYDKIQASDIADPALFFEWNTWRALEMIDDGAIDGNFRVDNNGSPLYTAPGNTPDIVCKYAEFEMIVEVTLSSGQRQYEMEGEPVSRHYGNYRRTTKKPVYAIFIAPQINPATLAHYFVLSKTKVKYYGGRSSIIPLELADFRKLLEKAKNSTKRPTARDLRSLLEELSGLAQTATHEQDWYNSISKRVISAF